MEILLLNSPQEALNLLKSLGAPKRLIKHLELVGEVGVELCQKLKSLGINFDSSIVQIGIAVHDAGKIVHPNELIEKGNFHEAAGEKLLLEHGVQDHIARCCLSHAQYDTLDASFEELLVALSDKLWKGKREQDLELRVIDGAASLLNKDRWDVFSELDGCFESIAANGDIRLSRSVETSLIN